MAIQVRDTRQKKAIRAAFSSAARPLSPEEALQEAAAHVRGISVATIYRNIHALIAESWLSPVEIPGEPARYEVAGKGHHHHFQCERCDRIYDLPGCTLQPIPGLPGGFALTGHELFLYGLCAACNQSPA
ncbi:Fur family transcriptional regulator [Acidipila sp. EB88]|uniref:Fur family transcriptional regulator n=1 Tax=Acidipila sp. EB88 TaxID=2305226 RepID=UPI000F5E33D7|nr:transcriptional repressor [Acidipila sp. EB88]RRA48699.1 transcriptional repressor [Acidipila sp. EB88]